MRTYSQQTDDGGVRRELAPPRRSTAVMPESGFSHLPPRRRPTDDTTIRKGSGMSVPRPRAAMPADTPHPSTAHLLSVLRPSIEAFTDPELLAADPERARREWLQAHANAVADTLLEIGRALDPEHPYAEAVRRLTEYAEKRSMA